LYQGNNCKKINRPCPGYELGKKFQDEGPKIRQRYSQQSQVNCEDVFQARRSATKFQDKGSKLQQRYLQKSQSDSEDVLQTGPSNDRAGTSSSSSSASPPSSRTHQSDLWDALCLDPPQRQDPGVFGLAENPACITTWTPADDFWGLEGPCANMILDTPQNKLDERFTELKLNLMLISPDLEQQQLLHIFTSSIAPPALDQSTAGGAALRNHGHWLARLPTLTGKNKLLDTAVRAVTLVQLGRLHGVDSFLDASRPFYGKALRLLNSVLLDNTEALSAETLGATILLSFYEMFASDSNDSWLRHAGGAGTLIRIRGPARHRYGFHRELYLAYRHTLILEACRNGTYCFLDEPEWHRLADQIHDDSSTGSQIGGRIGNFNAADAFFSEFVQIPGLLCDAGNLKLRIGSAIGSGSSIKGDIATRAQRLRANVKCIFARMSLTLRNTGHGPTSYASGDPVIPVYYKYINIFVASLHAAYWDILMLLNMVLKEVDPDGPDANLRMLENREVALDCCRSEPFMATSAFLGPFFSSFTLRLALAVLEPEAEREWILGKLFNIGKTKMAMGKHGSASRMSNFIAANPLPKVRVAVEEVDRIERMSIFEELSPTGLSLWC
jgi:hypothetical protein